MLDFLLDSDGDLLIQNGDFVVGDGDQQNIADIIQSFVGAWKQYPQVGVGIMTYLNSDSGAQALQAAIKQQLQADNFNVSQVSVSSTSAGLKVTLGTPQNPIKRVV